MSTNAIVQQHHYKEASENYHSAFFYSGEYESWQLDVIMKHLDISRNDRLLDLGGGTGRFASLIYDKGGLKYPVTCVDPSDHMLQQTEKFEGVDAICADALNFSQNQDQILYDRILMKEVVHHLSEGDLKATFSALQNKLKRDGKLIVCTRPHEVEYPFFKEAHEVWRKNQSPKELYVSLLEESGYNVSTVSVLEYPASLNIDWWINMIKNRFWSTFSEFDDNNLEKGINEIREKFGKSNFVNFSEKLVLIVAQKI